ncbi:MAG TPA: putative glycolipid-binding domain-containing protein [Vicinamibacteria bacterium]
MSQKWLGLWILGGLLLAGPRLAPASPPDEDDLVATGQFEILLVGKRIGEEQFRIYKTRNEYEVESRTTRYWPRPSQHEYYYKLESSFEPKELTHHLRQDGRVVTVELRKKGKNWRSEVKGEGVKNVKQDMGERQYAEIDMGSPVFQWVTFRRLNLADGEKKGVDVVSLEDSGLPGQPEAVRRIKRTYTRLPDESLELEGQEVIVASVYEVMEAETSYRLWMDPSGFPLRLERETPEGPLEIRRIRFRPKSEAW